MELEEFGYGYGSSRSNSTSDDVEYYIGLVESDLTDAQDKALTIAMIPSALLSVMGSGLIVYVVLRGRRKRGVYHRLILAMSIFDIFFSITWVLQAFLVPAATSPRVWAFGNDMTCRMSAFLGQIGTAGIWYNGMLSFYFLLTIRYNVSEDTMARKIEPWMHGISLTYAFVTATIGLAMDWYHENELGGGCWLNEIPRGCGHTDAHKQQEEDAPQCVTMLVGLAFAGVAFMVLFIALLVNNWLIFRHVRTTLQKQQRYDTVSAQMMINDNNNNQQNKKLVMVAWQCAWYVLAFWFSSIWLIIVRFLEGSGYDATSESEIYPLLMCQALFTPLQGFFNLIIFIRPRYIHIKQQFPRLSFGMIIYKALFEEPQHMGSSNTRLPRRNTMVHPQNRQQSSGRKLVSSALWSLDISSSSSPSSPQQETPESLNDLDLKESNPAPLDDGAEIKPDDPFGEQDKTEEVQSASSKQTLMDKDCETADEEI